MTEARDTIRETLTPATQITIREQVRATLDRSPLVRPTTPNGMAMRVRVSAAGRFGWVGDGAYRYDEADSRGKPWPPIPELWKAIADRVAGPHAWDCAIVNWYDEDASLGWHRDQSERDTSLPIVTISLGDSCSWAIRADEGGPVSRCRLETGDVTLLAGETRGYFHTIERLIAAPLFSPLSKRGRLSVTIRVAG
ncbi:unnamed protein product [marine sediment metagenome]|uniref:Fe2OG dioxygenase domain-containing protein n=1 Tax=marine sediment metagenome TaxID=412755 RepID=X0VCJ7_9ZZZZ